MIDLSQVNIAYFGPVAGLTGAIILLVLSPPERPDGNKIAIEILGKTANKKVRALLTFMIQEQFRISNVIGAAGLSMAILNLLVVLLLNSSIPSVVPIIASVVIIFFGALNRYMIARYAARIKQFPYMCVST